MATGKERWGRTWPHQFFSVAKSFGTPQKKRTFAAGQVVIFQFWSKWHVISLLLFVTQSLIWPVLNICAGLWISACCFIVYFTMLYFKQSFCVAIIKENLYFQCDILNVNRVKIVLVLCGIFTRLTIANFHHSRPLT